MSRINTIKSNIKNLKISINEKFIIRFMLISFYLVYFFSLQYLIIRSKYGKFNTNDEFGFLGILAGLFYENPSYRTYYINPLLSFPLKELFVQIPSIPWYGLAHVVTLFLIGLLFTVFILSLFENSLINKIQLYSVFFLFWLFFIYLNFELQMTHSAILAAGLGLFVFLHVTNKYMLIFSMAMAFIGLIWRFEGAILGFFVATLFYLQIAYFKKNFASKITIFKKLLLVAVTIFVVFFVNFFAYSKYSPFLSQSEIAFAKFSQERGSFHAWHPYYVDEQIETRIAKRVGWTSNDLTLLRYFFTADQEVYSYNNIKSFNDQASSEKAYHDDKQNILWLFNIFKSYILFFILFNLTIFLFYFRFNSLLILFFNLAIPALAIYMTLFLGSVPERVFYPILFLAIIFSAFSFFIINSESSALRILKEIKYLYASILIFILIGVLSLQLITNTRDILNSQRNLMLENKNYQNVVCKGALDTIFSYNYEKPIVAFSSFYTPIQMCTLPLGNYYKNKYFWNNMILLGWSVNSTSYLQQIEKLELAPDLVTSIAEGKAYLAVGENIQIQIISEYLRQHHEIEVVWPEVPEVYAGHMQVWSVLSSEKIGSS
jgi:hypothetical protein